MKLRNKKTGEIMQLSVKCENGGELKTFDLNTNTDKPITLAELNAEWEDAPEEPSKTIWQIKDMERVLQEAKKMNRPKDLNTPSRWNMRIWDNDKKEWLCQSDKDALTYYGFDITGGETTEFQGLPKWHPDRHLIWEQSTGLKDKNGKEIYEGDVVGIYQEYCDLEGAKTWEELEPWGQVVYEDNKARFGIWGDSPYEGEDKHFFDLVEGLEVIGNIHENQELLGGEE